LGILKMPSSVQVVWVLQSAMDRGVVGVGVRTWSKSLASDELHSSSL